MKRKMQLLKQIYFGIAVCLMISITIFNLAEGAPTPSTPRYGGTLRIGEAWDGVSIGYPPKLVRAASNRQAAPAIETLFHTNETGQLIPWLAIGSNENAAAKTITLSLREGVKFHDGSDFNAEAVKWNLEQQMAAKVPATARFKSIDVLNNYTLRVNLTDWDSTVTSNFATTLGLIISPTAYKKNGEEWCAKNPVGTGPFEFVSWQKDVRTIYKNFPTIGKKVSPI